MNGEAHPSAPYWGRFVVAGEPSYIPIGAGSPRDNVIQAPTAVRRASTRSVRSQVKPSASVRPKCPYAAVRA